MMDKESLGKTATNKPDGPDEGQSQSPVSITASGRRRDLSVICNMVEPGSKVLDIGCGRGDLLLRLQQEKNVDGFGLELEQKFVNASVTRGLAVVQGNADFDLMDYPAGSFDYVILSQTIQATRNPKTVLSQMLRIGRHAIVSFPNFGHWQVRYQLATKGRMPVSDFLPYSWYDTPNIHFCTIRDFVSMCDELGLKFEDIVALDGAGGQHWFTWPKVLINFFAHQAVIKVTRN